MPFGLQDSRSIIEALPIGVAVYDQRRHLVFANPVLRNALGVAPAAYRPGSAFVEHMRIAAHRGLFGPGDPEAQAAAHDALDFSVPHRFRRRLPDGRGFDAHYAPLPAGGMMVSVIETSAADALRAEAEGAAARIEAAIAGVPVGGRDLCAGPAAGDAQPGVRGPAGAWWAGPARRTGVRGGAAGDA